jgi:hypothetical protein
MLSLDWNSKEGSPLVNVGELRSHQDMEDTNIIDGKTLTYEVEINLNMLGALMLDRVGGQVDGTDVVAGDKSGPRQGAVQLHEQLKKLARLHHTVGHGTVLCLSAWMRDDVLALRGQRNEVVAQEHSVAWSGLMSILTTGLVNVSVDDEVRRRGMVEKQIMVKGALEFVEYAVHGCEIGLMGIMHVEAHLLDRIGYVSPDEGEVIESPSEAMVRSCVTNEPPMPEETLAFVLNDME